MKKVIVIGSGFSGLSAAASLARDFEVQVFEKNATPGGRARSFQSDGFRFDMGPSWYWMPDVFERFFNRFGKSVSDHYLLKRLDPSYRVYYGKGDYLDVPAGLPALTEFFERLEPGSGGALKKFLSESGYKYEMGIGKLIYKPGLSWTEFADIPLLTSVWKLNLLQTHSRYVRRFFKHPRLIGLLEFPILFLGAPSQKIPALYSLMNYADMALGTWYPMGGMYKVVEAMEGLAAGMGVQFVYDSPVDRICSSNGIALGINSNERFHPADFMVASADYHHVEKDLLETKTRNYRDAYWETRALAPSCLIFYLGLNKRVKNLLHHTLFFDEDAGAHLDDIFTDPQWPRSPQFYVCCPSKTDPDVAPPGCENLFILIPLAPGLEDTDPIREKYFSMVMSRLEHITGESLRPNITYARTYAHRDFIQDYNAFKGNAYGLANTLFQTANFKPAIRSRKLKNLFFTGQFTVPGPGVPPSIISGETTAQVLQSSCDKATRIVTPSFRMG